jgi:hypothetical protein
MIYVTSARNLTETLPIINACNHYKTYADAKRYAESFTKLRGQPCYIYGFGQEDCIEPKTPAQKFKLTFSAIQSEEVEVEAEDLHEAISKARKVYPSGLYELTRSTLVEGD